MILPDDQKPERASLDEGAGDLPPAYDALSIHHPTNYGAIRDAGSSSIPSPFAGPSSRPPANSEPPKSSHFGPNTDESLPLHPPSLRNNLSPPNYANSAPVQRPHARKNTSWTSFLPFASTFSAKQVHQTVLSVVSELVAPSAPVSNNEQNNAHEILASIAETCVEHKLSLSAILQKASIANHTPIYWAVVNYRQELLAALLVYSRPLSAQTVSDIRRACLINSNQTLFHALRVCRPPFHRTDGIQVPSLRTASDNLLLGNRPLDEIHVQQASDRVFVVSFDIPLWQKRMKVIGQVNIEFIVASRMWRLTFFSTDPSSPSAMSGKSKKTANSWHVMVSLLESSPPTYFDSQLVVDVPSPLVPESVQAPRIREARSMMHLSSHGSEHPTRSSMYDYNDDRETYTRISRNHDTLARFDHTRHASLASSRLPPPTHPLRNSPSLRSSIATPSRITVRVGCGDRQLGRRTGSGEPSKASETPTTKPDKWSDHGVSYVNAAVTPLGEDAALRLLYDHSRYLLPDGTLRGRLEARLIKSASSKDCIIC